MEKQQKRGRLGNTYHINDVWWTQGRHGGGGEGHCLSANWCEINDKAIVLLVTVDLVNFWGPGYR